MKTFILILMSLSSATAFAARPTTPGEARLICQALDRAYEVEQADGAVRLEACDAEVGTATHLDADHTQVSLDIPVYIEGRKTDEQCSLVYLHRSAHSWNIEGGDTNVTCK
jgi:hypothetical protein